VQKVFLYDPQLSHNTSVTYRRQTTDRRQRCKRRPFNSSRLADTLVQSLIVFALFQAISCHLRQQRLAEVKVIR